MNRGNSIIVLLLLILIVSNNVLAQNEKYKAAYIYQFGRIIEWPGNYQAFTIGVWNEETLLPLLNSISELKKINNKPIEVRKINSLSEIADCQIIYISSSSINEMSKLKAASKGQNILIISEGTTQRKAGAGISFVSIKGKLLFEIDRSNISNGGLSSPKALEGLAHQIY